MEQKRLENNSKGYTRLGRPKNFSKSDSSFKKYKEKQKIMRKEKL